MLHEAGGSSSAGSPQGCWIHHYSFRVLLTILHQKDVPLDAQDSLLDPHVLQQQFQPWGHSRSMGYMPAGCSNSDLKLQRRCGSLLPLGLFCWQSRFPARCLPTQRLTPAQAGGTGAHVHWDTCRSTAGCSTIAHAKKHAFN